MVYFLYIIFYIFYILYCGLYFKTYIFYTIYPISYMVKHYIVLCCIVLLYCNIYILWFYYCIIIFHYILSGFPHLDSSPNILQWLPLLQAMRGWAGRSHGRNLPSGAGYAHRWSRSCIGFVLNLMFIRHHHDDDYVHNHHRRKFRSQTSDNMDRWKAEMGRVREEKRRKKKIKKEKVSEERRSRCAKR